jgi:uncharacterized protein (TIGR02996 family)
MSRLHPNVRAALDEIKAHPADDTPRLMLADWLEEHGETESERARGTVLRLGCLSAARPGWDPRRILEEAEVRVLFRKHRDAWLGALPAEGFTLRRGLLQARFDREDGRLVHLADMAEVLPWVEAVELDVGGLERQQPAEASRQALARILADVRQLLFDGCNQVAPWIELPSRVDTSRLTTLSIQGWPLEEDVRALLARPFDSLRELHLPAPSGSWFRDWPGLQQLRVLRLSGSPEKRKKWPGRAWPALEELALPNASPELFAPGKDWPCLRRLTASHGGSGRVPEVLARSSLLGQLEALDLHNHARTTGMPALVSGRGRRLRRLGLRPGMAGSDAWTALGTTPDLPSLRDLRLSDSEMDTEAVAALASSPLLPQLESLDLGGCVWNPTSAAALARIPAVGQVRHLGLARCHWGAEILPILARQASPLVSLDLQGTSGSIDWLPTGLLSPGRFPELLALNLRDASLRPAELRRLIDSPLLRQLRVLDLTENWFDTESIRALFAVPDLAAGAWVRITDRGLPPDLLAAWRDRFGADSIASQEIPF